MSEPEPIVTEYLGRVAGAALLLAAGTVLLVVGVRDFLSINSGAALGAVAGSLLGAGFVIAAGWLLALAGALTAAGVVLAAR